MIQSLSRNSRRLLLSIPLVLSGFCLASCSEEDKGTGLRIITSFHQGLGIEQLFIKVTPKDGETKQNQTPKGDGPLESPYTLLVLLPESWASKEVTVEISGLKAGAPQADGSAAATIEAGRIVELAVQLVPECQETCIPGAKECVADQHRTCRVDQIGCAHWGVPEDCPQDAPYCSEGLCSDQCHDECEAEDQRRCTADGRSVQVCGQHDSDTCLDWGPTLSCQQQELCLDGQCVLDCGGAPCECQTGQTQACEDIGQCSGGVRQCVEGQFGPCQWQVGPTAETCDGKDNDCNGKADDGMVAPPCSKQDGVCEGALGTCAGSEGWQNCTDQDYAQVASAHGNTYETEESLCDGQDNDCDGHRDEASGCCPPDCAGKACGADDGCGYPCQSGPCNGTNEICISGKCVCQPDCTGKICGGDDGCGQPCMTGHCSQANSTCVNGVCECQFEACGGSCCQATEVCQGSSCCLPVCGPRVCGPDPVCNGSCGDCPSGKVCDDAGQCVEPPPSWKVVPSPSTENLKALFGLGQSDLWAASNSELFKYTGSGWGNVYSMTTLQSHQRIEDIWASSSSKVYLVMSNYDCQHLSGSSATAYPSQVRLPKGIWGTSDSNIWSVGNKECPLSTCYSPIQHFSGSAWVAETTDCGYLYDLWGSSASNIWAVGTDLCHYDGTQWSKVTPPAGMPTQYALWGSSASDIWSVGWDSTLLHYDGTDWTAVSPPAGSAQHLYGIHGTSSSDIWAVGHQGTILHYDGNSWSVSHSSSSYTLYDVWARAAEDVWAVGSNGTLLHYAEHPVP